ncbi:hypothetical protein CYMTET_24214 [Cymbomonas tetramitiformis]|uniref:Uncharacterized protein n=1 Tax=Cymbomonas tetramitiformis TaxID=36881 RepID=A0AAE0FWJ3_9CHLO|nr:hypothetical protein CYMTET_24214 [Cymbomonas tetramitiformis]
MGSGQREVEKDDCSEDDESESPLGYYDESEDDCVGEEEVEGHLPIPHISAIQLEQGETLDRGCQGTSYDGVWEPSIEEEISPQNEFHVGTISFNEPNSGSEENENSLEIKSTATE